MAVETLFALAAVPPVGWLRTLTGQLSIHLVQPRPQRHKWLTQATPIGMAAGWQMPRQHRHPTGSPTMATIAATTAWELTPARSTLPGTTFRRFPFQVPGRSTTP